MAIDKIQSESINLADTFAFTGTVTGAGGVNTPAFHAKLSSNFDMTQNVITKVPFNTEELDTDSKYDNSTNYRFTPTVAGTYYCYLVLSHYNNNNAARYAVPMIYKNGAAFFSGYHYGNDDYKMNSILTYTAGLITLDADDYIEAFTQYRVTSGNCRIEATIESGSSAFFGAYKILT